jgi:two-component system, OmpR family, response regulator MprA
MSDGPRVLVVDDDPQLREALSRALELDGYDVSTASNGVKALDAISSARPDLMVLDVMMPYVGGLDVCRTLRERKDRLPILVLTARDEVGDRVAGLDAGADDYLTKPFALEELRARLRALLRRTAADETDETDRLVYEDLVLDPLARTVHRGDRPT